MKTPPPTTNHTKKNHAMKTTHRIQTLLSCGIALAATFGMATAEVADGNKELPGAAKEVAKPAPAPRGVPTSDLSNPRAAFTTVLQAFRVRDMAAIRAVLTAADEDRLNMHVGQVLVGYALSDLREALDERSIDADHLPRWQSSAWDEELARVPEAVITVEGEPATLQLDKNKLMPPNNLMTFHKVGDAWKWDVGVTEPSRKGRRIAKHSEALVGLMQETIAEVRQGKYQTSEEAMKAIEAKANKLDDQ